MRMLEVRRHSLTSKSVRGSHLSARGVSLARQLGAQLGPFAYVLTSAASRAVETAIAMGFAVDETVEMPSFYVTGIVEHHQQWSWAQPYVTYADLLACHNAFARLAHAHRTLWIRALQAVPEGAVALVISHGGAIEPTLVACLPAADHASWGGPFAHCDGARLTFQDGAFTDVRFDRPIQP